MERRRLLHCSQKAFKSFKTPLTSGKKLFQSMLVSLNFTPVYSSTSMYVWVFLFVFFAAGVVLAIARAAWRKPIGVALAVLGVVEIVPFLLVYGGLVSLTSAFLWLLPSFLVEGVITLIGGLAIFSWARTKPP